MICYFASRSGSLLGYLDAVWLHHGRPWYEHMGGKSQPQALFICAVHGDVEVLTFSKTICSSWSSIESLLFGRPLGQKPPMKQQGSSRPTKLTNLANVHGFALFQEIQAGAVGARVLACDFPHAKALIRAIYFYLISK
jgi:hypothetical protein